MITSTNHNVRNPMTLHNIDLWNNFETSELPQIERLTSREFELIAIKDTKMYYILIDTNEVYLGNQKIEIVGNQPPKYLMGVNPNNTYTIYLHENNISRLGNVIPICNFKAPTDALRTLHMFSQLRSHNNFQLHIAEIVKSYLIEKSIDENHFIMSCISAGGYRESIKFRQLISIIGRIQTVVNSYVISDNRFYDVYERHLSDMLKDYGEQNELIAIYIKMFGYLRSHEFFKHFNEEKDEYLLGEIVSTIVQILSPTTI